MKKNYEKPMIHMENFVPNSYIAACSYTVTGTTPVNIYCYNTSHITVFTSGTNGCSVIYNPASKAEAENYFSKLFAWGNDISEASSKEQNAVYNSQWGESYYSMAKRHRPACTDSSHNHVGTSNNRIHAGWALDYLNAVQEGKLNS